MLDEPLVTIITPSFNQGQFIEKTIQSVLGQSYGNIEFIILDAMSTDDTAEVLERYKDLVTTIVREPDKGQSDAIVKGFKMAQGELVGWINSDDILYPDCVEKIVSAYESNPHAVLLYNSKINIISEDDTVLRAIDSPVANKNQLLRSSPRLIQPGSFYARDALIKVDYFDISLKYSMDLDLWIRLLNVGDGINLGSEPIAGYREWDGTKTSNINSKSLRERKMLLLNHGAGVMDETILRINFNLAKNIVKNIPIIRVGDQLNKKVFWLMSFIAYYGFSSYLPASRSRYTRWCRIVRKVTCVRLFRSSGKNINIEKGAFFGTGKRVSIGDNSGIGVNCKLFGDVSIGADVMMGEDVTFITTTHHHSRTDIPMIEQGVSQEKPIVICDDVWLGSRCTVLPGVTVGKGSIVGAASVVTKNVPEYVIVAGNPARVINQRCKKEFSGE